MAASAEPHSAPPETSPAHPLPRPPLHSTSSLKTPPRRVFLDCSATAREGLNTGIPRVVRNLVNLAPAVALELGIACQPVIHDPDRGFIPHPGLDIPAQQRCVGDGPAGWRRPIRSLLTRLGLLPLLRSARSLYRQFDLWRSSLRQPVGPGTLEPGPGDLLVLLDRSWDETFPWPAVARARARGAQVAAVVYDLAPLRHPQFFPDSVARGFRTWWNRLQRETDFTLAISRSVANEVREETARTRSPRSIPWPAGWFRLGADLDGATHTEPPRPRLATLLEETSCRPIVLMVGTLTSRKNHAATLDACDHLWASGVDFRLVIAGGHCWDAGPLVDRLRSHPRLDICLHWFDDLSDSELDCCYRHAAALVTPSFAEGFNLPIVEALSRGCPVLASDLPVHREVAGDWGRYFPAHSPDALASLLRDQLTESGRDAGHRHHFAWPTWRDSARSLLEAAIHRGSPVQNVDQPAAA